ncbi:hypothetical protein P154DRAFT_482176 [Amniculicola lignicola CBS 123094]|uniref:CENP-V/GFA domain-containing protein n=1 Tax=Amniculicola lignicola CBS 123094 TaxID=1392246 RepID=A0A6A5X219_9PLEO|nr:hypothetical protein P154DRAFT_482176 [Amniculicola lignicola CBS 123094]
MSSPEPTYTGNPNAHPVSNFTSGISGTCLCGSIRVTITDSQLFTSRRGHLCHCANCRKIAGSYVSANLLLERDQVGIEDTRGTLKRYEDRATGSRKAVWRSFCGGCGCPIMSEPDMLPDKRIVKMGMFPRIPTPEMENFVEHKQEWEGSHEGLIQYATARGGRKIGE